jgi:hypothetical protein
MRKFGLKEMVQRVVPWGEDLWHSFVWERIEEEG